MRIEKVSINDICPAAYNPRRNLQPGDSDYAKLKRSIQEFDMVEPLVWNKRTGNLVSGHQRLKILRELGWEQVEVSVVDIDSTREKALNVALNKISGEWDDAKLQDLFEELDALDFDLELTGFDEEELQELMGRLEEEGEVEEDEAPEPPDEAITNPGDIWILGRHRVMCGDSTAPQDVKSLLGDQKMITVTDPPYAVEYNRTQAERGGDEEVHAPFHEGSVADDFLTFLGHLPGEVLIMTYPVDRHFFALAEAFRKTRWQLRKELVWVKNHFSFWPGAKYQQQHEPILICAREGAALNSKVPSNESTVQNFPKETAHKEHPTQKPVELFAKMINHHADNGGKVYDPFLGSGTTLVAAEQLGAACYGMEIKPRYVDVTVERWENLTGETAELEK